jgi:hypothetical protein
MIGGYAIIPDGNHNPSALFMELEHALEWGVETYGCDAFKVLWLEVAPVERDGGARRSDGEMVG